LPSDVRSQLQIILDEVTEIQNSESTRLNQEAKQEIIAAGGKVRQLTAQQRAKWVEAMKPVWSQFEDDIGVSLIAAAQRANAME
jgi:C4-dicarboxylate-binding protein DctP